MKKIYSFLLAAALGTSAMWAYDAPEALYVVGSVNGTDWGSRVPMEKQGNKFVANVHIDAKNGGNGEFRFTSNDNENWDWNNATYQPNASNWTFKLSETTTSTFVNDWNDHHCWNIIPGQYILTVDFDKTEVSIKPGELYLVGAVNDCGWEISKAVQLKPVNANSSTFFAEDVNFTGDADFLITAKKSWNDDGTYKYGASSDADANVTPGTAKGLNYKYDIHFKVAPGVYDVCINVDNMTIDVFDFSGAAEKQVYFTNDKGWENVYAYTWDKAGRYNEVWPGVKLTAHDKANKEFAYKVAAKHHMVVFNNGKTENSEAKTADLTAVNAHTYNSASTGEGDVFTVPTHATFDASADDKVVLTIQPGCTYYYTIGTTNYGTAQYFIQVNGAQKVIARAAEQGATEKQGVDPTTWTKNESNVLEVAKSDIAPDANGNQQYLNYVTVAPDGTMSNTIAALAVDKDGATTGVADIAVEGVEAAPVYYNLQGVRVANPAAGNLYIKVAGKKATKVLFK